MKPKEISEIIAQVLHNPQVSHPPITYTITDHAINGEHTSSFIDLEDFKGYLERLEKQLNSRITSRYDNKS